MALGLQTKKAKVFFSNVVRSKPADVIFCGLSSNCLLNQEFNNLVAESYKDLPNFLDSRKGTLSSTIDT